MTSTQTRVTGLLLILGLGLVTGCSRKRSEDIAAIKKCHAEFRTALLRRDYDTATNYLSSELLARYSNPQDMIKNYFRAFTAPDIAGDAAMTGDAWVEFDRRDESKAFLFPHRPPTVGRGFVKEANGWKLTVNVLPIMD